MKTAFVVFASYSKTLLRKTQAIKPARERMVEGQVGVVALMQQVPDGAGGTGG